MEGMYGGLNNERAIQSEQLEPEKGKKVLSRKSKATNDRLSSQIYKGAKSKQY
jgi:hypothetical protein